jgi:hypothetical protein
VLISRTASVVGKQVKNSLLGTLPTTQMRQDALQTISVGPPRHFLSPDFALIDFVYSLACREVPFLATVGSDERSVCPRVPPFLPRSRVPRGEIRGETGKTEFGRVELHQVDIIKTLRMSAVWTAVLVGGDHIAKGKNRNHAAPAPRHA